MLVPKYLGRDCELSTTGISADRRAIPPWEVTQRVLRRIDAGFAHLGTKCWTLRARSDDAMAAGYTSYGNSAYSSDCLRQWGPNGQCYYSDMAHVEVCTAECRTPFEFAAQGWSTLLVAEAARAAAQADAPPKTRYLLSTANVDASDPGVSWGTHLNVAVSSQLFEDLILDTRRPGVFGFVTSALAAAIPFFGCGYLLPCRDRVRFSLSARAHHITRMLCDATTTPFARGLLNSRREPHASGVERLHLIGFDFNLVSAALLAAFVQSALALAETGFSGLELREPLQALQAWSLGIDPATGAPTAVAALDDGRQLTLGAYVREVAATMRQLIAGGELASVLPTGTCELLQQVEELGARAARGDLDACAKHLDWAAKLHVLRAHCAARGTDLDHAATRLLDHDFANTDPTRGALWKLIDRGLVDPLITRADAEACLRDGPARNRGWTRGRLVQRFHADLAEIAWDQVELNLTPSRLGRRLRLAMPDPGGHGADAFAAILHNATDVATLARLADAEPGAVATIEPMRDLRTELWLPPRIDRHHGQHSS